MAQARSGPHSSLAKSHPEPASSRSSSTAAPATTTTSFRGEELVDDLRRRDGLYRDAGRARGRSAAYFGQVDYLPTENLLEGRSRQSPGAKLFIGNQSSCNAIAEALKHQLHPGDRPLNVRTASSPAQTRHPLPRRSARLPRFFGRRFRIQEPALRARSSQRDPARWLGRSDRRLQGKYLRLRHRPSTRSTDEAPASRNGSARRT